MQKNKISNYLLPFACVVNIFLLVDSFQNRVFFSPMESIIGHVWVTHARKLFGSLGVKVFPKADRSSFREKGSSTNLIYKISLLYLFSRGEAGEAIRHNPRHLTTEERRGGKKRDEDGGGNILR